MERLKHHEALTVTGLGLYVAAVAYALQEVLAQNSTERDYWAVVTVLTVLCVCLVHGVDRVNDSALGVIELEALSQGQLTYLTEVAGRVTLTASFGFIAIFVAPATSVLYIIFEYRSLAADQAFPLIALTVAGSIFFLFAFGIVRSQRRIVNKVKDSKKRR